MAAARSQVSGNANRLLKRIESLESGCADWYSKLEAASATHHAERAQLQERYAAAESYWQLEMDRARQLQPKPDTAVNWNVPKRSVLENRNGAWSMLAS